MQREGLNERPVYFVSSNTHSLVNLLSGSARRHQKEIVEFTAEDSEAELSVLDLTRCVLGINQDNDQVDPANPFTHFREAHVT